MLHGFARVTYAHGSSHMGQFIRDKMHGKIRFTDARGNTTDTLWENDRNTTRACDCTSILADIENGDESFVYYQYFLCP